MTAVTDEVFRTLLERLVQPESGDGAARALSVRMAVAQCDHQHRAGVLIDEPARDDAEQAGMPARAREHQRRRIAITLGQLARLLEDAALDRLAFVILPFQV